MILREMSNDSPRFSFYEDVLLICSILYVFLF